MAPEIAPGEDPWKGNAPVAISYSTAPNENRSVRASSSSARACSGDIYATVPNAEPGLVRCASTVTPPALLDLLSLVGTLVGFTLANPKSRILACPRLVMKIFPGF